MANTEVSYLHRDSANYKQFGQVVFAGDPPADAEERLKAALDEGEYFIARQIGVPERFFDGLHSDDHCWHEFHGIETTNQRPTDPRTIEQFIADVERVAAEGWQAYDYVAEKVGPEAPMEARVDIILTSLLKRWTGDLPGAEGTVSEEQMVDHLQRAALAAWRDHPPEGMEGEEYAAQMQEEMGAGYEDARALVEAMLEAGESWETIVLPPEEREDLEL